MPPRRRPRAAFEPYPPDLDVEALVDSSPNFEYVVRIHRDMIDVQGQEKFEKLVLLHVVIDGKPLVVEGYQGQLDRSIFGLEWLKDTCGMSIESPRDLTTQKNIPMTIGHYLKNMALLTNQWDTRNYKEKHRQRLYLKDIDCPEIWRQKLEEVIPKGVFYLNESTGDAGDFDTTAETRRKTGIGAAKAGDLMSSLPQHMRAENMMCYIGHEGTYTPSHREMCASLGHNIMVETSTGDVEDGKPTVPGSSLWLMTESKDRHVVSEYWLSRLGHDIEVENHFAQINAWKEAPFKVYVVEQQAGDFILIPPLAPHQVWNRGTRTMKAAWNRTTVETLELALDEALPGARMVCRDEQYKTKAIVYYTMEKYSKLLAAAAAMESEQVQGISSTQPRSKSKVLQLMKDFKRLHVLYTRILLSECLLPDIKPKIEFVAYEGNITCSYCRCDIFNRFLTCPWCIQHFDNGEADTYDICMECYAMGRSCACISRLKWVEQFKWNDLVHKHELWRRQIIQSQAKLKEHEPKTLQLELDLFGRRTLAQICQLELKKRPWNDISNPRPLEKSRTPISQDEEPEVDDDGRVKKKKRKLKSKASKDRLRDHKICHLCHCDEPVWKQAHCSCGASYCYGSLFRAFDIMPQTLLEDLNWKCPKCLEICICTKCSQNPKNRPFEPTTTVLGHDTKKIADPRSVESLVDFSYSNLHWLKKAGDDDPKDNRRLKKRAQAAEEAKSQDPEFDEHYVSDEDSHVIPSPHSHDVDVPIDPALASAELSTTVLHQDGNRGNIAKDRAGQHHGNGHMPNYSESNFAQLTLNAKYTILPAENTGYPNHQFIYPEPDGFIESTQTGNLIAPAAKSTESDWISERGSVRSLADIETIVQMKRKGQQEAPIIGKKLKTLVQTDGIQPPPASMVQEIRQPLKEPIVNHTP